MGAWGAADLDTRLTGSSQRIGALQVRWDEATAETRRAGRSLAPRPLGRSTGPGARPARVLAPPAVV